MALINGTLLRGSISPRGPLILTPSFREFNFGASVWGFSVLSASGARVPDSSPRTRGSGLSGPWGFKRRVEGFRVQGLGFGFRL